MPDCILRVSGAAAKVRKLLATTALRPCAVFFRGEPTSPASSRLAKRSGFNVVVSRADGDLQAQARDALRFLRAQSQELAAILKLFGAGHAVLDFGLWDISSPERPWPSFRLPHQLVEEAGRHGCEIVLSFYGPPGGE
jgi:hypothetical protein